MTLHFLEVMWTRCVLEYGFISSPSTDSKYPTQDNREHYLFLRLCISHMSTEFCKHKTYWLGQMQYFQEHNLHGWWGIAKVCYEHVYVGLKHHILWINTKSCNVKFEEEHSDDNLDNTVLPNSIYNPSKLCTHMKQSICKANIWIGSTWRRRHNPFSETLNNVQNCDWLI
jgi:hypothetical protein